MSKKQSEKLAKQAIIVNVQHWRDEFNNYFSADVHVDGVNVFIEQLQLGSKGHAEDVVLSRLKSLGYMPDDLRFFSDLQKSDVVVSINHNIGLKRDTHKQDWTNPVAMTGDVMCYRITSDFSRSKFPTMIALCGDAYSLATTAGKRLYELAKANGETKERNYYEWIYRSMDGPESFDCAGHTVRVKRLRIDASRINHIDDRKK